MGGEVSRTRTACLAALRPVYVSQHTCNVLGFKNGRAYLEWLPTSGLRVVVRGKDRLVRLEDAEQALLRLGEGDSPAATDDEQPATADAVLARIGRTVAR
jgi:hypothetical protein